MPKYLIVGQHSWSKTAYHALSSPRSNEWYEYFGDPKDLPLIIKKIEPDIIFFLHWSYIVPDYIVNNYECICFHPSHLPYGRGGTPIQNLIKQGFETTKLTAFRMTKELDAGPIYLQSDLSLDGTAQEIYIRIAYQTVDMIKSIIKYDIQPHPQEGEPVYFSRRTPSESAIVGDESLDELYDHIRMVSAEDYPHAFIEYNDYIIEFMEPSKATNSILANAVIYRKDDFND